MQNFRPKRLNFVHDLRQYVMLIHHKEYGRAGRHKTVNPFVHTILGHPVWILSTVSLQF